MTDSGPADAPREKRRHEITPSQRALGLLARREHSRKELAAKLTAKGVAADEADQAVRRMTAEGWQDDRRFAASLARLRMAHGYGPIRIRAELGSHRLDEQVIAFALKTLDAAGEGDWPAIARDLVRRRYGKAVAVAADPRLRRKAADFLIRRGFDGDSVRFAMSSNPHDACDA
ncbi:MAG: regulatory protein RecX [Luteimonas sp.]